MNNKIILIIILLVCILASIIFLLTNYFNFFPIQNINPEDYENDSLNCEILVSSLELGTQFLINNQKPEGNFNYEYDFVYNSFNISDNEVRQAGALWGIALIYNYKPDPSLKASFKKGFDFFKNCSIEIDDERKWIAYPSSQVYGSTGTIALVSLSIIEFLRADDNISTEFKDELENYLDKYLEQLMYLRMENGQFHQYYYLTNGTGAGFPSPYYDGESLLALIKAAKYMNKEKFISQILDSANKTYEAYVYDAIKNDIDSTNTKGFFQWGCMSYFELATSKWNHTRLYSDIVIDLADWMINIHQVLERTRNTAYAFEGIIHAYELARRNNDLDHVNKYISVIDDGLYKLTTWQVGGSIQNIFLINHPTTNKLAIGGIMNHREESPLRIDVTQHQMHAVILAMKYVYNC